MGTIMIENGTTGQVDNEVTFTIYPDGNVVLFTLALSTMIIKGFINLSGVNKNDLQTPQSLLCNMPSKTTFETNFVGAML